MRFVKRCGKVFFIDGDFTSSLGEKFNNALAAEVRHAELELYADIAELYASETCSVMRSWYAKRYRDLVGVSPELRHEFAAALDEVIMHGHESVKDLIARLEPVHGANGEEESSLA